MSRQKLHCPDSPTHPQSPTNGKAPRETASVFAWYSFMAEKLGATSKDAGVLTENVITAIELNPLRAAKFPELFSFLHNRWCHFSQKRKLLDQWLTKMLRDPLYWPTRLPLRGSRVGDQILKALRTGQKTDVQIVRAFPKSAKMTPTKLNPTIGLAIKAGKIMRVGWGEYALPESGLPAYISPNRLLVDLVTGAPDYPPAEGALVATMRSRGHTDDGTYHSLKWLRECGIFAPKRNGRVELSAESLAKKERNEELRDGRGMVLWGPPLVVPTEVATWECRLNEACRRDGTPLELGNAVTLRADRPRVDPSKRAAEVSRLASLPEKQYAEERESVAKAWGLDDVGMLDLMVVPARKQRKRVPRQPVTSFAQHRTMKLAALEPCVQAYLKRIEENPDGASEARAILEKKMKADFAVFRDEARSCRAKAIEHYNSVHPGNPCKWDKSGLKSGG